MLTVGLSPLARGTQVKRWHPFRLFRFIPAGAGNSVISPVSALLFTVYPRWRGELVTLPCIITASRGLSPLARGTHPAHSCVPYLNRFIPAGAGNSRTSAPSISATSVYPRWRGELFIAPSSSSALRGLSPLARGTLMIKAERWIAQRFIPAGAGNSGSSGRRIASRSVYPRWRGELW